MTILDENAAKRRERIRRYGVPEAGTAERALAERHLAAVLSVIIGSRTWRSRGGTSAPEVQGSRVRTGPAFRAPRVTAETRTACRAALTRALQDVGARPSELGGNSLAEAADLIVRSLVRSGSLRLGSAKALRDGFIGDLNEALVRRMVLPLVPRTAVPEMVSAVEGGGLLTLDGRTITGKVRSATVYLLSSTKTTPSQGFADHLVAVRVELADGTVWNVPLVGVEVKFPGVVEKAPPQMGKHVSRIRDLALDGALRGLDEGDRPVLLQARSLLLSPNFSSFGLAPQGRWLEPGQTSRPYSTRVGNKVQTFAVYEAEVSAPLVTTVADAVRDAALGARRSALFGNRDPIISLPGKRSK